ncbi:MAG: response regulator [Myxococcota bacterium]
MTSVSATQYPDDGSILDRRDPPLRLLVLDDSEFDALRIERLARDLDQDIVAQTAKSISEFQDALSERSFDLVVVDYRLPDGDGFEAVEILKSHELNAHAVPIMVAGEVDTRVAVSAVKAGCIEYIPKSSLSIETLREAITEALRSSFVRTDGVFEKELRAATSNVIEGIADACFKHMKPNLAKMLRQVRNLRSASAADREQLACDIEQNCLELWHFLHEFDHYRNDWKRRVN